MTEAEKELVIKDLCGRLPYGVKVLYDGQIKEIQYIEPLYNELKLLDFSNYTIGIEEVKAYLRPISTMTEEEKEEYTSYCFEQPFLQKGKAPTLGSVPMCIDWFNKKMLDYRGLIPNGLAEIALDGMYENTFNLVTDNTPKITVGCKIRSKTNPDEILSIISDDCHGDEFECSNGSVLSLKQIEKYYDLIK